MKKTILIIFLIIFIFSINLVYASTTYILQGSGNETLYDAALQGQDPNGNYGELTIVFNLYYSSGIVHSIYKYNISAIPGGIVSDATLNLYMYSNDIDSGEAYNVSSHQVFNNFSWIESVITYNTRPTISSDYNATRTDSIKFTDSSSIGWYRWNITEFVNAELQKSSENVSIYLFSSDGVGNPESADYVWFRSREDGTASTRPYLNITHDLPPIIITVSSPEAKTYGITENNITIEFSASGGSGIDDLWYYNESDNTTYTPGTPQHVILSEGSYIYIFYANDTSGTEGSSSVSFTITYNQERKILRVENAVTQSDVMYVNSTGDMKIGYQIVFANLEEIHNTADGWITIVGSLNVTEGISLNNKTLSDVYCINFSNGDTMCGNSSIDVSVNGSKYLSISDNGIRMYDDNGSLLVIFNDEEKNFTARFEGSMMNNDNINDSSRFVERNKNNGSFASAVLTVRNDIPYSASFGLTSSTFSYDKIGANTAGISLVAPGEMLFMNRYNYPFIWYINKENDSSVENLSEVMRLDEDGLNITNNLNVVGNITGNMIYGNLNRGGNATTRPSSVNVSTGTLVSGNITSIKEIDGDVLEVDEVGGTPGYDIIVNYTDFSGTPRRVEYVGRYQGITAHNVEIRIFNYSSGSYGEINSETGDIPSSSENLALSFMIEGNLSDFVSGGVVSIQVIHTSNGVPSHKQFMDFLTVTSAQYSIPDVGQFVKIDNYGTSSDNGVKVDSVSGNMTILVPGGYRIEASSSFVGDANSFLICSVFKNDIEENTLRFVRRLNAGGDIASACLGKVLDNLEVNDVLNLRCSSEIEDSFVTFTNLDFYMERISD